MEGEEGGLGGVVEEADVRESGTQSRCVGAGGGGVGELGGERVQREVEARAISVFLLGRGKLVTLSYLGVLLLFTACSARRFSDFRVS